MISLVSLAYAKRHLVITDSFSDVDISAKIALASYLIMRHCKLEEIPDEWIVGVPPVGAHDINVIDIPAGLIGSPMEVSPTSPTNPAARFAVVPGNITIAVLLAIAELFANREASTSEVLSQNVINVLYSFRDPTFA